MMKTPHNRPEMLRSLSWQSYALVAVCVADLASTIWLCRVHDASEANPIMAYFLAQGIAVFAMAKMFMTAVPLSILEWARRARPRTGVLALNTALLGYVTLYGAGLAHINNGPSIAEGTKRINEHPAYVAVLAENARRVSAKRKLMQAANETNGQTGATNPGVVPSMPMIRDVIPAGPGSVRY